MNLICQLRNFFFREEPSVSSYDRLLTNLNRACSRLPEGQAFLVTGDGELTVRLTWKPQQTNPEKRLFSLNGQDEVTEWVETAPSPVEAKKPIAQQAEKEPKQQRMMQRLSRYLKLHYAFRYNMLTERTECAHLNTEKADEAHHLTYTPVDSRTLNGISLNAIENGVECWDRDIKRYVESDHVQAYHPFELYFKNLPEWDGKDRVTELAKRVSDKDVWVRAFHRWMLAVTAQWTGSGNRGRRANSVAPLLVSPTQGLGKSTFCRMQTCVCVVPTAVRPNRCQE